MKSQTVQDANSKVNHVSTVKAPANLALVKYWGKSDASINFPTNDSLSFVFDAFWTKCSVRMLSANEKDSWLLYSYDSQEHSSPLTPAPGFFAKAKTQLARLRQASGNTAPLEVSLGNNFPHGCGIASSASSMAALTAATVSAWTRSSGFEELSAAGWDKHRLASFARLGSGSACRSILPGFNWWSRSDKPESQTVTEVHTHPELKITDTLVLVNTTPKKVPSSLGHLGAQTSPLFLARLAAIDTRIQTVKNCLATNSFERLGDLCETEALELHAIAMSSAPPAHYLLPATSELLAWVRNLRKQSSLRCYFTLDAGANVHILSRSCDAQKVKKLVTEEFPMFRSLQSKVGSGLVWVAQEKQQTLPTPASKENK